MSAQADAIAEATEFLAAALTDGVDADYLSRFGNEQPMALALVADMAVAWMRGQLEDWERVEMARALRFSVIASLAEHPID